MRKSKDGLYHLTRVCRTCGYTHVLKFKTITDAEIAQFHQGYYYCDSCQADTKYEQEVKDKAYNFRYYDDQNNIYPEIEKDGWQ